MLEFYVTYVICTYIILFNINENLLNLPLRDDSDYLGVKSLGYIEILSRLIMALLDCVCV